jgi:hypothetical protein
MPRRTKKDCTNKHPDIPVTAWGGMLESQRKSIPFRHKCPGCAYEAGLREGIRRARKALAGVARNAMPKSPVTGKRGDPESDLDL